MGDTDYQFSSVIRTLHQKKIVKDDFFLMDGNFVSEINLVNLLASCRKLKESNKGMIMSITGQLTESVGKN